ncbi:hypothetical protein HZ320_10120 [[Pasteurella] aerogenes]|nr:hypothetical protein HZ320_10120 [[Pasteurella] aerogenes]
MKEKVVYWFRYLIRMLFTFRTPIGVNEYRIISLVLLVMYFILKIVDSYIIPIFNQHYVTSSSGSHYSCYLCDYGTSSIGYSYTTLNPLTGIMMFSFFFCFTVYLIATIKRVLDLKNSSVNFKANWYFYVPLFFAFIDIFYRMPFLSIVDENFFIGYFIIFIVFSFKVFLQSESRVWWGNLTPKSNLLERIFNKLSEYTDNNKFLILTITASIFLGLLSSTHGASSSPLIFPLVYGFLFISIFFFIFHLIDFIRIIYFVHGSENCKENPELDNVNRELESLKKKIVESEEVTKTVSDIKQTVNNIKNHLKDD